MSTTSTSLNHSHTHVSYGNEDSTNDVRYRSISMALSHASLGTDLDTDSCILMVDRANSTQTSRDVNNSDDPTKDSRTEMNGTGILGNHTKTETEDPDRLNEARDSTWANDEMASASNEDAIKQLDSKH